MPAITDIAIVIRRWDFSETSQTVSLFTRAHGIIRGLAKGAKREKGSFSGGLDVLTRGEIVAIVKPGRDLATLTAWHLQETYRAARESLHANRMALYMADLVHHLFLEHDPHPAAFDALAGALDELHQPGAIEPATLKLQWALLVEAGYRPELDRDARSGAALPEHGTLGFSAAAGGVVAETQTGGAGAAGTWRVRRETIELLREVARSGEVSARPEEALRRANRLLAAYVREIIGSELPALRWAFPELT